MNLADLGKGCVRERRSKGLQLEKRQLMCGSRWGAVLCPQVLHRCLGKQSAHQSSRDTGTYRRVSRSSLPHSHRICSAILLQ